MLIFAARLLKVGYPEILPGMNLFNLPSPSYIFCNELLATYYSSYFRIHWVGYQLDCY